MLFHIHTDDQLCVTGRWFAEETCMSFATSDEINHNQPFNVRECNCDYPKKKHPYFYIQQQSGWIEIL